jgi:hypothetical protein
VGAIGSNAVSFEKLAGNTRPLPANTPPQLKPYCWPKGVSGNPEGRPAKSLLQKRLEEELDKPETVEPIVQAILASMQSPKGMAGVIERRNIQERVDGPIKQELAISGELSISLAEAIAKRRQDEQ